MVTFHEEFRRLSTNPLITLTDVLQDFISRTSLSITTVNCLLAQSTDLNAPVIQRCNILILSETWNTLHYIFHRIRVLQKISFHPPILIPYTAVVAA